MHSFTATFLLANFMRALAHAYTHTCKHIHTQHAHTRIHLTRFTRRAVPFCHECSYVCDGDANGVLHYIGTAQGTQVS